MAIQMILVIGLGVFGGVKLDQRVHASFPVFTLSLTLLAVGIAMAMIILKVMRSK
jgi:hypothetical protein